MATIHPFRALRPRNELAAQVAAVPYDVVNRAEAKSLAHGNALSFLHVTKPEIDLPDSLDPYDDRVYTQGAVALNQLLQEGALLEDEKPCLYAYALTMAGRTQTGIVCCASVKDYDTNLVRKHEFTRPTKEDDRVKNIDAMNAQSGTVFLAHRHHATLEETVETITQQAPLVDFVADDEIRHRLWVIDSQKDIAAIVGAFEELGPIYIADGHHRSAAASRIAALHRDRHGESHPESQRFLAVSFPENELFIMGYNRVVKDLLGKTKEEFLNQLAQVVDIETVKSPTSPKTFGMLLDNQWYTLKVRDGSYDAQNPVSRLDVSLLQEQILTPLLGIQDPRRDTRIDFVGGIRGDSELEKRVESGQWAVAFKMHPTAIGDLFAIADAQEVMPPKSTWFEPKLRDGLFVHKIEEL